MRGLGIEPSQPSTTCSAALRRAGALAILLFVAATGTAHAALNSGPWPMFHRDLTHEAYSANPAPTAGAIVWSAILSDTVEYGSPVVSSSGKVYIGDLGKVLWAFDINGTPLWHYHSGGNFRYGTPAVGDNGTLYIGGSDGTLYALTEGGILSWTAHAGGAIKTAPAIAPDGTIYVGADDGKLWAFNSNGTTKWSYATGDTIRSNPAVGSDGTIYFGSVNGYIYAIYPTGLLRWRGATGGPIRDCSPAIDASGNVIIGSSDMLLYSIQPTGVVNWATNTGHQIRSSPAIGPSGRVYLGIGTKITAYHTSDGSQSWEYDTLARVSSSPAVTNNGTTDIVLCGSDSGNLYELKGVDGTVIFTSAIGSPIRSSPAIGPTGLAYFGAFNKTFYAIGQANQAGINGIADGALRVSLAPNPMRGDQRLRIDLSGSGRAAGGVLMIFDPAGRAVRTIGMEGSSAALWDGRDGEGRTLPSGVYYYRFQGRAGAARGRIVRLN